MEKDSGLELDNFGAAGSTACGNISRTKRRKIHGMIVNGDYAARNLNLAGAAPIVGAFAGNP